MWQRQHDSTANISQATQDTYYEIALGNQSSPTRTTASRDIFSSESLARNYYHP